ncbi:MAG: hypothetical protein NUV82_02925 [Candidatus Komeilibacteria bacterium]|nr:hypothetical protein [Candidatus Komeilibacteria bacterium]
MFEDVEDKTTGKASVNTEVMNSGIYTMPRFSESKNKEIAESGGDPDKKKIWLIGGAATLLLLVIGLVVYLLTDKWAADNTPQIDNPPAVSTPVDVIEKDIEEAAVPSSTPTQRDDQRVADVTNIRSALALYFRDYKAFPDILADVTPTYIAELPVNPSPGGLPYSYLPKNQNQSYELTFGIESGAMIGSLQLQPGEYKATPDLIKPLISLEGTEIITDEPPTSVELIPGLDSDKDGLTDIEENLYVADSAQTDSDGDGYTDATEITNLYDPNLGDSARLESTGTINIFSNNTFNYQIFYPTNWSARPLTATQTEIIFNSGTTEFVQVITQPNPLGLSAKSWYLNNDDKAKLADLQEVNIKGLNGVQTSDGLRTYLSIGTQIYGIIYNLGTSNQLNYLSTYQMMLVSFKLIQPGDLSPAVLRDQQRAKDVQQLYEALTQFRVAQTALPSAIDDDPITYQLMGSTNGDCALSCYNDLRPLSACADITALVPNYLNKLPSDPVIGSLDMTGYYVNIDENEEIVVGACQPEGNVVIEYK